MKQQKLSMTTKRKPQILCIGEGRRTQELIKYLLDNPTEVVIDLKDRQIPPDIVIYDELQDLKNDKSRNR
ncbi:MAG: hypothetical protein IKP66_09230 [Lachnospiraceae bacterium]|nr:hypothetical protein [Lachnospiraceae bacterium]